MPPEITPMISPIVSSTGSATYTTSRICTGGSPRTRVDADPALWRGPQRQGGTRANRKEVVRVSFYFLDHHPGRGVDSHRTELLKEEPVRRGEGAFCEACHKPVGPLPWLPPYRAEIHLSGREFGDIAFGAGYSVLVSDRFREAYEGAGLTGLDQFCCVEVVRISGRRRSGKEPPVYYKTDVRRGRAYVDDELSGIARERPLSCLACRREPLYRVERVVIAEGSWGGEDIFVARGLPGRYIVSERFKSVAEANELRNVVLIPAEQYHYAELPPKADQEHP